MPEEIKYDIRLLDRMLDSGRITRKEYDGYLKGLADTVEKADNVEESLADRNDAVMPEMTEAPKAAPNKKAPKKAAGKKKGK